MDHTKFGGSLPRAFSPGLSSIGAAGFMARHSNDANFEGLAHMASVGNAADEEEKKMANTFGSIQALIDKQPGAALMNNYPLSEDELGAPPV